jgi:pSer/pThr/pTyr-binding forkhead associated (FHA) protein
MCRARLVLNCEEVGFVVHELVGDIVMIGRAPSNHIVIDHSTVSGQHALLLRIGDSYWLQDLNSTNGTHINGVFRTDAELNEGDTIRFGSVRAVFAKGCRKASSSRWWWPGSLLFGLSAVRRKE